MAAILLPTTVSAPGLAYADEGGVSFWLPRTFGSLAATPQQAGWSGAVIYYHDSVSAGGNVAFAKDAEIGRVPINLTGSLNANRYENLDLGLFNVSYVFATPVFGAQASASLLAIYGGNTTSLAGTLSGTLTTPLGSVPFSRFDAISNSITALGDLYPQLALRWNAGVRAMTATSRSRLVTNSCISPSSRLFSAVA